MTYSSSRAGQSGVEGSHGAVALRLLCCVCSRGVGCVHRCPRDKQELGGGRHIDVS